MFNYIFLLYIFSDISQIQELFPLLARLKAMKVLAILSILGIFIDNEIRGNFNTERLNSPLVKGFILLILLMVMLMPFSIYPGNSFRFLTEVYWKNIILFILILSYGYSESSVEKMVWAYVLGIGLYSLYGAFISTYGRLRISESLDSNEIALNFVVLSPFVFWKIVSLKGLKRIIPVGICLLIILALIKTGSRGGFLGLSGVLVFMLFQLKSFKEAYFRNGLLVCFIIISLMIYYGDAQYWGRISTITNEYDPNIASERGRIAVWQRGINMIIENPVVGVGVANFIRAEGLTHYEEGGMWMAAHNSFIQIGAETGFPGLICFSYIIFKALKMLKNKIRLMKQSPLSSVPNVFISNSIIGAWTGFIISGFFLSAAYTSLYVILVSLTCVITKPSISGNLSQKDIGVIL